MANFIYWTKTSLFCHLCFSLACYLLNKRHRKEKDLGNVLLVMFFFLLLLYSDSVYACSTIIHVQNHANVTDTHFKSFTNITKIITKYHPCFANDLIRDITKTLHDTQ